MEKQQCSARIPKGWHRYQCLKTASVVRDDKPWCGTHDPERLAIRDAQKEEKEANESAELKRLHDRAVVQITKLGVGIPDGSQYNPKNPVTGVRLTFEEAAILLTQLRKGGYK